MWEKKTIKPSDIVNPKFLVGKGIYKRSHWEKEEIKTLIQMWDTSTIAEMCAKLGRSPTGIANIATILRRKYNVPLNRKTAFRGSRLIDKIKETLEEMGLEYNK